MEIEQSLKPKKGRPAHAKENAFGRGTRLGTRPRPPRGGEKGQKVAFSGFLPACGAAFRRRPDATGTAALPEARIHTTIFKKEHAGREPPPTLERFDNGVTVDETALSAQAGLVKGKNDGNQGPRQTAS